MAIKAYVLVVTDPGKTKSVRQAMGAIDGVVEIHEVMGPYDIVAEIRVDTLMEIPPILGENIRKISGIQSTMSLVTLGE